MKFWTLTTIYLVACYAATILATMWYFDASFTAVLGFMAMLFVVGAALAAVASIIASLVAKYREH